jgi:hypothetical protein
MDELVKLVAAKTGLSPELSRTAVEVVLGFLKDKLPDPIASQLDTVLAGGEGGSAANLLGGILGR